MTNRIWFSAILCGAFISCSLVLDCVAQTPRTNVIPRVGTIKDYPATGLMTGCGNLYFYRASETKSSDANYVFLASGDGSNAWMNLAGRDVRLRKVKSSRGASKSGWHFNYLWNGSTIRVVIEPFKPEGAPVSGHDSMFKMKITITKGRALRIIQAVGDADC